MKPSSKFHASARLFAYSELVIHSGGGFFSLSQCEPLYFFGKITDDYNNICYASYLAELTEKTILEGENCDDILNLLLYGLRAIEKGRLSLKLIRAIYEFKFMQLCGFTPELSVCVKCGGNIASVFYFGEYGITCERCAGRGLVRISETAVYALKYIFDSDVKKVFSFKLPEEKQNELTRASDIFLQAHSDTNIKSAGFLM